MGTTSSRPARSNDTTLAQLQELIQKRLQEEEKDEQKWKKEMFKTVRIVVMGRSGAGKSTLIRLITGKDGPLRVSRGTAGVQDINTEYCYHDSGNGFSLIIHDSNGVDANDREHADLIRDFLQRRQKSDDFSERVHLVWYLVSSVDTRCLDDTGIMRVASESDIPMLLILTFNDFVKHIPPEDRIVTDDIVDKLLDGVKDKDNIKGNIVRVGNAGLRMENEKLVVNASKVDQEALKLVSWRSQKLMDQKLRYAWVTFQAVDMKEKQDASAEIIMNFKRKAFLTCPVQVIPFADCLSITAIFYRILACLCEIWRVPPLLKSAMQKTILYRQGLGDHVLRSVLTEVIFAASLGASVAAAVLTFGLAIPAVAGIAVLGANRLNNVRKGQVVVQTFGLQVLVVILYVKCTQPQAVALIHDWEPNVEEGEYVKHCKDISSNHHYEKCIKEFAKSSTALIQTVTQSQQVKDLIKTQILYLLTDLHLNRPNSLYTLLSLNAQISTAGASSAAAQVDDRARASSSASSLMAHSVYQEEQRGCRT